MKEEKKAPAIVKKKKKSHRVLALENYCVQKKIISEGISKWAPQVLIMMKDNLS